MKESIWTSVAVRLAEPTSYPDPEADGPPYRSIVPKGDVVHVKGFDFQGSRWVDGIARPTMHGGGIHVDTARTRTGLVLHNVVVDGAYVATGDVIRSMMGLR